MLHLLQWLFPPPRPRKKNRNAARPVPKVSTLLRLQKRVALAMILHPKHLPAQPL